MGTRRLAAIPLESLQQEIDEARVSAGEPPLFKPRRLAAVDMPVDTEAPQITSGQTAESSMLSLGVPTGALVCAGCVLHRYYKSLKTRIRKDSVELTELVIQK